MAAGAETARLDVVVRDADAIDWIVIRNREGCGPVSGEVTVDFATSAGGVVIDTVRGGGGTLNPAEPQVMTGLARIRPVADGAREITILFEGLEPEGQIIITLDIDSGADGPGPGNVVARGPDIAESAAVFTANTGEVVEGVFDATGAAALDVPADCLPREMSFDTSVSRASA